MDIKRYDYDELSDVLYIYFSDTINWYEDRTPYKDVFILKDCDTDTIIGVKVCYADRCKNKRQIELNRLDFNLNLSEIITKLLSVDR